MKRTILAIYLILLVNAYAFSQATTSSDTISNILNFTWMPDGKGVCFSVIRSDKSRRNTYGIAIFTRDLASGKTTLLMKDGHSPAISPDGKKMAYTKTAGSMSGNNDIYLYDLTSRSEKPLAADTLRESAASWSPDGKKIVYAVQSGREKGRAGTVLDLWVMEIGTGKKKQITQAEKNYRNYNPVWAPEGNRIVYYFEKGDQRDQIYLTDENGSFHTNVTSDTTTHNYYPTWYGKEILYTQNPGKPTLINPDTGKRTAMEGFQSFWAFYNAKTDKILYMQPGSRTTPGELRIFDPKSKISSLMISGEELSKIKF